MYNTVSNYNEINNQLDNKNKKKKKVIYKESVVSIDSNNRYKNIKLITETLNTGINTNGIKVINNHTIEVHHPNHGFQPNEKTQIILLNVVGDRITNKYLDTIGGIPIEYINYNEETGKPIHTINVIPKYLNNNIVINSYTNKIESDYYLIHINSDIQLHNIAINTIGGGSNIAIKKVVNNINAYSSASHYRISLGKKFKNIVSVSLISIEMLNAQLAIRNKKPKNDINDIYYNSDNYPEHNDTIYWINKDDATYVNNKYLINDNRIKDKIVLNSNSAVLTSIQQSQSTIVNNFVTANNTNIYIPNEFYNNINYWPYKYLRNISTTFIEYIKLTTINKLGLKLLSIKDTFLLYINSVNIPIATNVFLNGLNTATTVTTLVTFISTSIKNQTYATIISSILLNGVAISDVNQINSFYKFFNNIIIYYDKYYYLSNLALKKYAGYWEVEDSFITNNTINPVEHINNIDTIQNEYTNSVYIDTTKTLNKNKINVKPLCNDYTDDYKLNVIETIENVTQYCMYPIYTITIDQGTYTSKNFIEETESKFNKVQKNEYDYNKREFINKVEFNNKLSLKVKDAYPTFKVNLDDTKNTVKIKQYKDIFYYSNLNVSSDEEQGPFIINEGWPWAYVRHKDHNLKTGDIIKIDGATSLYNIPAKNINEEHNIYVNDIYKFHVRMLVLTSNTLLNNNPCSANSANSSYYYYHGYELIDYASYKSGNGPTNVGSGLLAGSTATFGDYELILKLDELNSQHNITIGRIVNLYNNRKIRGESGADENGNIEVDYELLTENNFKIGDIIISSKTNAIGMIVPENYGDCTTCHEICLPTKQELSTLTSDIVKLNNISCGYSLRLTAMPNKTTLTGIGGKNVNIRVPISFSLLFDYKYTPYYELGFNNSRQEFSHEHSNTNKTNIVNIDFSYLNSNIDNVNNNRYLVISTLSEHNFNKGSHIYIDNHQINYKLQKHKPIKKLQIDTYETFANWLNKFDPLEQTNINNWLNTNYTNFGTQLLNISLAPAAYFSNRIVIYYYTPYSKKQKQDLGNCGMTINQYSDINYYDMNEDIIPNIYNINVGEYIYVYNNSKKMIRLDDITGVGADTGIPDGFYKVLANLPADEVSTYYSNFNKSMNAVIIDYAFNETILFDDSRKFSWGYLNRGIIKAPTLNTQIAGYNKTPTLIQSVLNEIKTAGTKLVSIPIADKSKFSINHIIYINTYYINNTTTFIDNELNKSLYKNIEANIIEEIYDDVNNTSNATLKLKYPLINNHVVNESIYQGYYITFLKTQALINTNTIVINNTTANLAKFTIGNYIIVNWNESLSNLTDIQKKLYIEDLNYITNVSTTTTDITITLKYTLYNTHNIGKNVVLLGINIEDTYISTQNFVMNNKWHTRIFYNGIRTINDRVLTNSILNPTLSKNVSGNPYVNDYLTNDIFIDNMNGFIIPNTSLNTSNIVDTSYNNIMPIPSKHYDTVTYTNPDILYKDFYKGRELNGYFNNINWVNDSEIATYNYSFNYNSITIEGKFRGFSGVIENKFELDDTYINYSAGFEILDTFRDQNNKKTRLLVDLKSEQLDINPPGNLLNDINTLTALQKKNYIVGYGGTIYEKEVNRNVNIKGPEYIYMAIPELNTIVGTSGDKGAFAKILLTQSPGKSLFNSFVSSTKTFLEGPLDELNELEIKFFTNDNKIYDFRNQDHSFTLKIIEEVEYIEEAFINSNTL
tara:strand:+ start:467 stop:5584 length:5118 start_codon:yes stop_codon:yes gene_type:complete